ncbi:MAG: glycerol-3-phosphate 1-O-acyltransferase PlsB, partial [Nevskiaceae bacterium]|nr:glycerol-3-phosphate 1-O-acyltransferase PlsB [Nevskiaceae bacterium]
MLRLLSRLLLPWVRFSVRPPEIAQRLAQLPQPVCYVMEQHSVLDALVVQRACARLKMPRPGKSLVAGDKRIARGSMMALARQVGLLRARLDRRPPPVLQAMLAAARGDPHLDVTLLPVAVYWGRRPERESGWLALLLSEDWTLSSRLRRLFTVLFNSRNTLVEFGQPVTLRALIPGDTPDFQASRRIARNLMMQLDAGRTAYIGPDLSHRRTLRARVLRTQGVRAQVAQQARERKLPRRKVFKEAQRIFDEIAADYSPAFVQFMERLLRWLWTRIYSGVEVAHARTLGSIASGNELVYVPCHRSTMDDVLTPYAVYTTGFVIPHIVAGLNLNLPVVGTLMRKGGTFFMRRSFRGNALYTAVFMNYLGAMMARGHPLQYFIEGGRSRNGRSLQPKTGMLSMTVRSYLRQPVRPVVFVPVYLGYERIIEAESYVGELSGKPKEKETLWDFLRSLRRLRENFGFVHVNIGEPIPLQPLLDRHLPQWREQMKAGGKMPSVNAAVDELAPLIMQRINAAAAMTPVNLLALVLLATPRQTMFAADLARQLEVMLQVLRAAPYSSRVTITHLDAAGIIEAGHKLEVVQHGEGG